MTAFIVFPAAVPSAVLWCGLGLCLFAGGLLCFDRRTVAGLVLACACAGAGIAHETTLPKPDAPIYCPCSFAACLLGICVPNHPLTADARQPWILR